MKDLLKLLDKPIQVTAEQYYSCGHKKKSYDRHKKCQKCRKAGGYAERRAS